VFKKEITMTNFERGKKPIFSTPQDVPQDDNPVCTHSEKCRCCLRFLESSLPEEIDAAFNFENENLSALNEMCRDAEQLSPADREKLGAVVSFAKPEQAGEIANLAKNLEQFDYVPKVRSPEKYGKHMIMEPGHFEYDENLVGYIDFAKYGKERVENEQGQFNDRGYVSYHGTLSLDKLMTGNQSKQRGPQIKME